MWKLYPYKKKHYKELMKLELNRDTYVKNSEVSNHEYAVDYYVYCLIITTYFKEVLNDLFTGLSVTLPHMGTIQINKRKTNAIDWVKTKEKSEKVFFTNKHTDGYVARVIWNTYWSKFRNRMFFRFKLTSMNRKKLSKLLKDVPDQIYNYPDMKTK